MNELIAKRIRQLEIDIANRKRARSFATFVDRTWPGFSGGWFYDVLHKQLEEFKVQFVNKQNPRLAISVPPRHGKSETIIRFAVWLMLQRPTEIIYASYSQDQANRLSRKAKAIVEQELRGRKLSLNQVREWTLPNGSVFRAIGRGGGITGSGCDLLITDDMLKNQVEADSHAVREGLHDWYQTTAKTRLSPGGGELQIGTRWHDADLIGFCKYPALRFSAIAERDELYRKKGEALHERFPLEELLAKKEAMLPRHWSCLYGQNPIDDGSSIVKVPWMIQVNESMIPPCEDFVSDIVTCDAAFKGTDSCDFVAISRIRFANGRYYITHVLNSRMFFTETVAALLEFCKPTDHAILIEDKANGPAIIDVLSSKFPNLVAITPMGSKGSRLQAVAPMFQSGSVVFAEGLTEWHEIVSQFTRFPACAHDDILDSITQGLNWLRARPDMSTGAMVVPFDLHLF